MTTSFLNFSIETVGGSSQGCLHKTVYRVKQLNTPLTKEQIESLGRDGYLSCGQRLDYDMKSQVRTDSGDGMNFYYSIRVTRVCDSSD